MKTREQVLKEIDERIALWFKDLWLETPLIQYLGWTKHQFNLFDQKEIIPNEYWELNEIKKPDPWIVCAANKHKKSHLIICGARHWDSLMRGQVEAMGKYDYNDWDTGFVDQFGEYYDREEAWVVAERNNQIVRRVGGDNGYLYSENLY